MSPLRLAGGLAKGTAKLPFRAVGGAAKLGYRGLKGSAMAALDVAGALPMFMAATGVAKKVITAGYRKGKELLRPIGEGAVAEDSALQAIAAAASETAKINAETEKIEAEADALKGEKVEPKTSMGGVDVEILEKIFDEVVSIRGIVGDADPESEKKELALDEATRHKKFLKALGALATGKDTEKGPNFFGSLVDMFKGFLPTIIAGLGLAGLIALWPKISSAFEGIGDAISNINEFLADMSAFFKPLTDFLGGTDPSTLAAGAGALKGTSKSAGRNMANRRQAMRDMKAESKRLAAEEKAKRKADEKARKKSQKERAKVQKKLAADAEKARIKKLADAERARLKKVGKSWKADKVPTKAAVKPTVGKSWKADKVPTKAVVKPTVGKSWKADKVPTRAPAPVVEKVGKSWKADKVPTRALPGAGTTTGGRSFIKGIGPTMSKLFSDADADTKSSKPSKIPGWKAAASTKPFVNPITQKPMSSRYYFDPDTGRWHDASKLKPGARGGPMVKGATVSEYLKKAGMDFEPGQKNLKMTAAQMKFMGEKPGFVNRMQGSMKWMGKAAGPLAVVFIGYAIKNAYDAWKAAPSTVETKDKWPFNDTTPADTKFKIDMAALAASHLVLVG